jgi:hypothetical protein
LDNHVSLHFRAFPSWGRATWPETILFWIAAAGLFWPTYWIDIVGLSALVVVVLLQKFYTPNPEISKI